jgi:phosphatidylglycerol lysyltransferase
MYGVQGRTWAALGDPVGPVEAAPELIRAFIERADDFGGCPVFYQVHPAHLHRYADFGMTFAKLGEEARVALDDFTLAGSRYRELRHAASRLEREGIGFRVVDGAEMPPPLMAQLRDVSDNWLAQKSVSEKGFSLGFFDVDYLSRLPVAVLEREGRVVAFANLLPGPGGGQLSIDLMRSASTAPSGAMDGMFAHLFTWGREHGYHWFNLGMAPLSGLEPSPVSSWWTRLGRFVYRHGEPFYNFAGLRSYKEKFHPVWEPRYLAYPGRLALPIVLADIAALSAGGYVRIFR